jgi:diguanylate cyclase (GGDEF)-like protein
MGLFILAAAYTSTLIRERQDALQQVSRYNVTWLVSQAVVELGRLQQRIAATAVPGSGIDKDEVHLRLDIVENRLGLLGRGEVEELVRSDPEFVDTVDALAKAVAVARPLVDALDDPAAARKLLELLSPLDAGLSRLAAVANTRSGERVAEDQRQLSQLHWIFSGILATLLLCGLILVALLLTNVRWLQRAHWNLEKLADDLRQTSLDLHMHKERFEAALNNMSQALCMADGEQRLIVCNRRYLDLFGIPSNSLRSGTRISEVFGLITKYSGFPITLIQRIYDEQVALIVDHRPATFFEEDKDGLAIAISHMPMEGGGWVATYENITERRRTEARVAYMAHHDTLTGLPNRVLFREKIEQILGDVFRTGSTFAVLYLDLDNFKDVNDTLGHSAGDLLLERVAGRLRESVRDTDVVARLGGDEFAILYVADQSDGPEALARRLLETLSYPYELDGQVVVISVSIGIAFAPSDGRDADELLKNADLALYGAKGDGRATYRSFEAEMDTALKSRRLLELDLREALRGGQFEVFYQPLYDLSFNGVSGFEALLRWRHPDRGMVSPMHFIPLLERTGLITSVGEWVLRQACTDAMQWRDGLKVAVNLSPVQFKTNLVDLVADALAQSGLCSSRLEVEITETALLQDNEIVLATLHRLREMGVRIALDDFGTGYASLSYLRQFPFDKIKIDRSFVAEMAYRPDCLAIVNSVAALAASLDMTTAAEGVETAKQLELVRLAGCTEAQGYYFDPAKPAAEVLTSFARSGIYRRPQEPGVILSFSTGRKAARNANGTEVPGHRSSSKPTLHMLDEEPFATTSDLEPG